MPPDLKLGIRFVHLSVNASAYGEELLLRLDQELIALYNLEPPYNAVDILKLLRTEFRAGDKCPEAGGDDDDKITLSSQAGLFLICGGFCGLSAAAVVIQSTERYSCPGGEGSILPRCLNARSRLYRVRFSKANY